jgi:DNA helicase HerA-like ATPase
MTFQLPNHRQRVAIMGRTGSGKTQFGAWVLSRSPFDRQPYVMIDYKRDELLNACDRVREIGYNEIPKHPGLYILHPMPDHDDKVEAWLLNVWKRGKIGLYFDEAYMLPDKTALRAILTQGRSKNIPAICLTQRPSWISRFVFTEADYYAIFHLNDERDKQTVRAFTPPGLIATRLPQYHCAWYDVGNDEAFILQPVPDADTILDRLDDRLSPRRKAI